MAIVNINSKRTVALTQASVGDQIQQEFKYKGFSSSQFNRNFKLYDIELVKQDILNHFYIRKGEKLNNPNFGTIIWDLIFEPFTNDVQKLIVEDVEEIINYDPRIEVESIFVDSTDVGIRIEAVVNYLQFDVSEKMQFDFDRENSIVI
jgi:phage baseplate assembly protein W